MRFKVLDPTCVPYKKHSTDAGYDLRAGKTITIRSGEVVKIGTGVCVEIPAGYVGDIRPRSSTSLRGLILPTGTVDHGYTGEVGIIIHNSSTRKVLVRKGERIAQLVVTPCLIEEIETVDELTDAERGKAGFGSTGVW